ncbi:hypothetical protein E2C01_032172 [Portunus trituberculatus]|uniref:Uncharacterized protein n=1 Tax=Portunus trituberculatus TaxID=210409 RepID=A0A5B7F080_PORTR|nr:hypothetical protein [Portunus trituberculatus]
MIDRHKTDCSVVTPVELICFSFDGRCAVLLRPGDRGRSEGVQEVVTVVERAGPQQWDQRMRLPDVSSVSAVFPCFRLLPPTPYRTPARPSPSQYAHSPATPLNHSVHNQDNSDFTSRHLAEQSCTTPRRALHRGPPATPRITHLDITPPTHVLWTPTNVPIVLHVPPLSTRLAFSSMISGSSGCCSASPLLLSTSLQWHSDPVSPVGASAKASQVRPVRQGSSEVRRRPLMFGGVLWVDGLGYGTYGKVRGNKGTSPCAAACCVRLS